jgi:adenosylmethionine-8-amino-7-oxononanoate aminotransferase
VYLMPPLVIGSDDLERLIAAVYNVLVEAIAAGEL